MRAEVDIEIATIKSAARSFAVERFVVDELRVREAAMLYVASCADRSGGVVTRAELEAFTFEGEPIKLIDQSRGIRNPRQLEATLTVLAQPSGPYADTDIEGGRLHYAYRTGHPDAGDNRKLRRAAELGLPLILLRGIDPGLFVPTAPVYVTRAEPDEEFVEIALDEGLRFLPATIEIDQRSYIERVMRERVHQPMFRAKVIRAYDVQCAMCRLKHPELLDAAHILPDRHEHGLPMVSNGLSLCKIHHAAFDNNIVGIRPDLVVEVQSKVLLETDGPMLRHGLQEMNGIQLAIPRERRLQPDRWRLEQRFQEFRAAS